MRNPVCQGGRSLFHCVVLQVRFPLSGTGAVPSPFSLLASVPPSDVWDPSVSVGSEWARSRGGGVWTSGEHGAEFRMGPPRDSRPPCDRGLVESSKVRGRAAYILSQWPTRGTVLHVPKEVLEVTGARR